MLSVLLGCLLGTPVKEHDRGPWIKEIKVNEGVVYTRNLQLQGATTGSMVRPFARVAGDT